MRRRRIRIGGVVFTVFLAGMALLGVWAVTSAVFAGGSPDVKNTPPPPSAAVTKEPPSKPAGMPRAFTGTLEAQSAVLVDEDGKVLFDERGGAKRYPASTTKVLTALVALEIGNLDDVVRVGDEANLPKPGSSTAQLRYGEKLTFAQLLNAMLIPSGNDAAYVIAAYIGRKAAGDPQMDYRDAVEAFIGLMNRRAEELGAAHSHFTSPDGYHDEQHYTTAGDMALIAREAMKHKEFREIVVKTQYKLPDVKVKDKEGRTKTQSRVLENTNLLLDDSGSEYLPGCTGIKTGHTSEAGYCLVASAARGGESVIAVVLDSTGESVWGDASALLAWGLGGK